MRIADLLYVREGRFMPRKKSRITLTITADARAERLADMSDADVAAEGFDCRDDFELLWDKLRPFPGQRVADNPHVIVICFTAAMRNVDDPQPHG